MMDRRVRQPGADIAALLGAELGIEIDVEREFGRFMEKVAFLNAIVHFQSDARRRLAVDLVQKVFHAAGNKHGRLFGRRHHSRHFNGRRHGPVKDGRIVIEGPADLVRDKNTDNRQGHGAQPALEPAHVRLIINRHRTFRGSCYRDDLRLGQGKKRNFLFFIKRIKELENLFDNSVCHRLPRFLDRFVQISTKTPKFQCNR